MEIIFALTYCGDLTVRVHCVWSSEQTLGGVIHVGRHICLLLLLLLRLLLLLLMVVMLLVLELLQLLLLLLLLFL